MDALSFISSDRGKRFKAFGSVAVIIVSLVAGSLTLAINSHRALGILFPDLLANESVFVDWHENYEEYETTILNRTKNHLVIITQFVSKGLCQFQGRSTGTAIQNLPGGLIYSRVLVGAEDFTGTYDIPVHGPRWVTFAPFKMVTSGLKPNAPFTLQFVADFKCDGKDVKIKYPIINVPAVNIDE